MRSGPSGLIVQLLLRQSDGIMHVVAADWRKCSMNNGWLNVENIALEAGNCSKISYQSTRSFGMFALDICGVDRVGASVTAPQT